MKDTSKLKQKPRKETIKDNKPILKNKKDTEYYKKKNRNRNY